MQTRTTRLARIAGCAASLGIIALWLALLIGRPYGSQGMTGATYLVAGRMMAAAAAGFVVSLRRSPYWLLAVFAVSFLPVGLYLLGAPGIFRWIGALDLALAAAAGLMIAGRRRASTA